MYLMHSFVLVEPDKICRTDWNQHGESYGGPTVWNNWKIIHTIYWKVFKKSKLNYKDKKIWKFWKDYDNTVSKFKYCTRCRIYYSNKINCQNFQQNFKKLPLDLKNKMQGYILCIKMICVFSTISKNWDYITVNHVCNMKIRSIHNTLTRI